MDTRLREGIGLFNSGCFFESHQSFKDFYLGAAEEHKPFLEDVVQLAAACRLFTDFGEVKGPVRMIRQALIRLDNYQSNHLGVQVKKLIRSMERWTERVESNSEKTAGPRHWIPKIRSSWFSIL